MDGQHPHAPHNGTSRRTRTRPHAGRSTVGVALALLCSCLAALPGASLAAAPQRITKNFAVIFRGDQPSG